MGGSGGGKFFFLTKFITPEDISKKIRHEEERSKNEASETEVADSIRNFLQC